MADEKYAENVVKICTVHVFIYTQMEVNTLNYHIFIFKKFQFLLV